MRARSLALVHVDLKVLPQQFPSNLCPFWQFCLKKCRTAVLDLILTTNKKHLNSELCPVYMKQINWVYFLIRDPHIWRNYGRVCAKTGCLICICKRGLREGQTLSPIFFAKKGGMKTACLSVWYQCTFYCNQSTYEVTYSFLFKYSLSKNLGISL